MFKTFKFRLVASCLALVLFSLGLAAWLVSGRLQDMAMANLTGSLAAQASLIEGRLAASGFGGGPGADVRELAMDLGARLGHRVTLIGMDGAVLADSEMAGGDPSGMDNHAGRPEVAAALKGSPDNSTRYSSTLDKGMFYFARPAFVNGRQAGVIRLSVPLSGVEAQLAAVRKSVAAASAIAAALALLLGLWLMHVLSAPFAEIIAASKRFAAGDLSHRARVAGYGELKKLAQTLNSMAEALYGRMKALERAEAVRKDFVANVSHELKTPLTAIRGSVETLIDGAVDDRENRGEFLGAVLRQTGRLEVLVNDLLRLSRLESAAVRPELSEFRLRGLVEDVHRSLLPAFKGRRLDFSDGVPEELQVRADRKEIEQALFNLLDNAFKFTPDGGSVSVSARAGEGRVRVEVSDTGPGIPEESMPRIFERFYRVDKARSRELGGTGLGLSIVKHAVELHGGSVGVESEEGRGSTFWFTLPA